MRKFYLIIATILTVASVQANGITGNFSICLPGPTTTQLTGSGIPAASNPWISSNPAVATVNTTGLVTSVSFGTTTIIYTDNLGVSSAANVYVSPFPTISAPFGTSTCAGVTLQLQGSLFANAITPWTSLTPAIATVDSTGLVTGVSPGIAIIQYMNLGGCTSTMAITIKPVLSPIVTCGASTSSSITFNWNAVVGASNYVRTYQLNSGPFMLSGSGSALTDTLNGLNPGDVVDFYVAPSGVVGSCFQVGITSCTTNINCNETNIPAAPVVTLIEPTCISPTGSIAIVGVIGNSYSLDGGPYTVSLIYDGLPPGSTHTISAKNTAGCISNATIVTIGNQPSNPGTVTLTSSITTVFQSTCPNSSISPVVFTIGNGATGAFVASGSLPSGITGTFNSSSGTFTISGNATQVGTFNYVIATTGGCGTNEISGVIVVHPSTTITLTSSPESALQSICQTSLLLPIEFTTGNGAIGASLISGSVPQGVNAIFSAGVLTISGTALEAGTFQYTVATIGGCDTATLTGVINVNPVIDFVTCDASQTTATNSVYFDWQSIPGVTIYSYSYSIGAGPIITGTTSESHYEVFDVFPGQSVNFSVADNQSACQSVGQTTCTLLSNDDFQIDTLQYFPNPLSDILNIKCAQPINNIQIFNLLGQQVFAHDFSEKEIQINLSDLSDGTYLLKAKTLDSFRTFKIVKN